MGSVGSDFVTACPLRSCSGVEGLRVAGGGPEDMAALLEGESLFNDASAIVLFDIFLQVRFMVPSKPKWVFLTMACEVLTSTRV